VSLQDIRHGVVVYGTLGPALVKSRKGRLESGDDVLLLLCGADDDYLFEAAPSNTFSDQNYNKHSIKKANSLAHAQAHCPCICQFNQPPLVQ
jgi:hypothetical protein